MTSFSANAHILIWCLAGTAIVSGIAWVSIQSTFSKGLAKLLFFVSLAFFLILVGINTWIHWK